MAQSPYGGTPWPVPGLIKAVDYDEGGEGEAYHDTTSGNTGGVYRTDDVDIWYSDDPPEGYYTGANNTGEWVEYTVDVAASGQYYILFRIATPYTGRNIHVEQDGVDVTGAVYLPNTGSFGVWDTVVATATLTAGEHILRVFFDYGQFNFNWMDFLPVAVVDAPVLDLSGQITAGTALPVGVAVPAQAGGVQIQGEANVPLSADGQAVGAATEIQGAVLLPVQTSVPAVLLGSSLAAHPAVSLSVPAPALLAGGQIIGTGALLGGLPLDALELWSAVQANPTLPLAISNGTLAGAAGIDAVPRLAVAAAAQVLEALGQMVAQAGSATVVAAAALGAAGDGAAACALPLGFVANPLEAAAQLLMTGTTPIIISVAPPEAAAGIRIGGWTIPLEWPAPLIIGLSQVLADPDVLTVTGRVRMALAARAPAIQMTTKQPFMTIN
jgi:hypothetical protein